ncbi:MAG: DUF1003 domain-containing protein [Egibacteraceae bacterium]
MSPATSGAEVAHLSAPRGRTRRSIHYDTDRFGRFSEGIAAFLGTATYLVAQTAMVIVWMVLNVTTVRLRWDPYPFILLNLLFSTQASYAAPLILLAQNRQAERDRAATERDREVSARTLADTEYLARELVALRLAVTELSLGADVTARLERLEKRLGKAE